MTSTCKPTRNVALDLIRVVAIVLVLWQHASEYYYIGDNLSVIHANIPLLTWMNSVARICVPLFVMISGYLLLPVSTSTATFFRRRFTRILFPWVFWCVAYAVYFMLRSRGRPSLVYLHAHRRVSAGAHRFALAAPVWQARTPGLSGAVDAYHPAALSAPCRHRAVGRGVVERHPGVLLLHRLRRLLRSGPLSATLRMSATVGVDGTAGGGLSVYCPDLPLLRLLCQGCRRA